MVGEHQSRLLTAADIQSSDLILAMSRDHRRIIVEMVPASLRKVFTVREFGRLSGRRGADEACRGKRNEASITETSVDSAWSSLLTSMASQRGLQAGHLPEDDDVIDPYRRSNRVYLESVSQMSEGLFAVERVVRQMLASHG